MPTPRTILTAVLLDGVKYAANVGAVQRQLSVLQGQSGSDCVSALLLANSRAPANVDSGYTNAFCKKVLRISMAEMQASRPPAPLVLLPQGDLTATLKRLRSAGYVFIALENFEACCRDAAAPSILPLWDVPLGEHERVLFLAGGEVCGLGPNLLRECDFQCYIPGAVPHWPSVRKPGVNWVKKAGILR